MWRPVGFAVAIGTALTLAGRSAEATESCGYVDLTGEHMGECGPNKQGPVPQTLDEVLQALDQRLPKLLRDRCTEDKGSICDCILRVEVAECWSYSATRTPLVKWFMDQGVATSLGIAELVIIWLKRRIHEQDLRINEEIARYLAANHEYEKRYKLGWISGNRVVFWVERYHPHGSMRARLGELIPFYERFSFYLDEHAQKEAVKCWQMIPLGRASILFEVSMRLFFVPLTKKWVAQIESSTLPRKIGDCMVRALSGLELPDYYGLGPYALTILGDRGTEHWYSTVPYDPGPFPKRFPWLGLGGVLTVIMTAGLLIRRRLRRKARKVTSIPAHPRL